MGQLPRRMEIEHETVVDRLIDLQAELRGERSPRRRPAGDGSPTSSDQWAYGASRKVGATAPTPVAAPITSARVALSDHPQHPAAGSEAPTSEEPVDPVEVSVGDVSIAMAQEGSTTPPVRLASILARAQEIEHGLTKVIDELDETAERLETSD